MLWEYHCPVCEAPLHAWDFTAPTDYYRCWQCLEATPFHELPKRKSLHKWTGGPPEVIVPPTTTDPYTRFYFTRDGIDMGHLAPISPTLAAWDDTTQTAYRPGNPWMMFQSKDSRFNNYGSEAFSATTTVDFKTLLFSYVSEELTPGLISGTAKGQMLWSQDFADCAQDRLTIALSVVSNDGTVNRGYLLPLGFYGTTNLFATSPNPAQNRFMANGDALTPVVAQSGDRLFLEIGSQPSVQPNLTDFVASFVGGQNASDLPEDETSTTVAAPWFQLTP